MGLKVSNLETSTWQQQSIALLQIETDFRISLIECDLVVSCRRTQQIM